MFAKALLVGAFALLASAQSSDLFFTRVPNPVTAGQQIAITYSTNDSSTPVTILLRKGASTDLQTVATLTDSATSGQYIWTPSTSLENAADYALEIKQGSQLNYFGPFSIQGGGASSSSTSSSGASSATTSSAHGYGGVPVITSSAHHNTTATSAPASLGTGVPIHRNTTMSHATLTSSASLTSQTTASSTSESAGFQTTSPAATHTGAASTLASGSSILTLVFGAVAAMLFC